MTALIVAAFALVFVAYKVAKLAVLLVLVTLAVCVGLATAVAVGAVRLVASGLAARPVR
jgi:hypothetical protein